MNYISFNNESNSNKAFTNSKKEEKHIQLILNNFKNINLYNLFLNDVDNSKSSTLNECNEINHHQLSNNHNNFNHDKFLFDYPSKNELFFNDQDNNQRKPFNPHKHKHNECFNNHNIPFDNLHKKIGFLIFKKFISKGILIILILWIIKKEKIHGYGIMKYLDKFFSEFIENGFIPKFNSSKIYTILHDLEKKEFIAGEWALNDNKQVKYYTITPLGVQVLENFKIKSKYIVENEFWTEFFDDLGIKITLK